MGNEPSSPREETFIHFPLEKCTQVLYTAEFVSYFKIKVFTARRRSLREGNVFNHVCLSVHRGGSPCDYFPWCHMGTPSLPHEPMGPLPHPLPLSWACSNFFTWDSPTTWTCLNLLTWGAGVPRHMEMFKLVHLETPRLMDLFKLVHLGPPYIYVAHISIWKRAVGFRLKGLLVPLCQSYHEFR